MARSSRRLGRHAGRAPEAETIAIVCEGEKTEDIYFNGIRREFRLATARTRARIDAAMTRIDNDHRPRIAGRDLLPIALPRRFCRPRQPVVDRRSAHEGFAVDRCEFDHKPRWLTAQTVLVAALWSLGSEDEARITVRKILAKPPEPNRQSLGAGMALPPPE